MKSQFPYTRDLVLIGGGHTHALVLRKWGMNPLAGARLTLINPGPTAPYSGMLPGFVAGHYTRAELDIDLVRLCQFAGARLIDGAVTAIDPDARVITVPGRPPIGYDVASVDIGITSDMPQLAGFADHGVPAKPLGPFAARWDAFRDTTRDPHLAVIGGGVAGAELALAMAHALQQRGHAPVVRLIDRGDILSQLGYRARTKMLAALTDHTITLVPDVGVQSVSATEVTLTDGRVIRSDFTTGAAGAKPHDWMADIGVAMHDGFIAVDAQLQSSDADLFAVGDCAHLTHAPRPKAGVFAVRQAPVLLHNLRARLAGHALVRYQPQGDYLKLISLGGKRALAEKFGTAQAGWPLWRWKDRIDRRFMRQFDRLPAMTPLPLPRVHAAGALADKAMCGGCGSKVGRAALRDALGNGTSLDDAAVLTTGDTTQVMSTDHLRAFWDDPVVMTRIAVTHALGDIWAMGATPQAATLSLILPRMSPDLQRRTLSDILTAARATLSEAGCDLVGGHTSQGAEMHIGATLTGLADRAPITLAGAAAGQALILTKPLGSGTVMAAAMAGEAAGREVLAALNMMQHGQAQASAILSGAAAMTDVTGFGLAGHLMGICCASGVAATLTLGDIPLLDGALALAAAGTRSSLFDDNRAAVTHITGPASPAFDLLFDPQTAGGLLAAVPADAAANLVAALRYAGYEAALIGHLHAGPAHITVT